MSTYRNPTNGRLSSPFNPRRVHPVSGAIRSHNGADVANVTGTPVLAAHDGTVRTGYEERGGGHWIFLTSDDVETRYLHLSRRDVTPGQKVQAGQQIGLMGSTGNSTGPHLHFEVRVKGTPTDPVPWLAARGVTLGTDPASTTTTTTPREVEMIVIRKGNAKAGYSYRLITGSRAVPISNPAVKAFKAKGVAVVHHAAKDFDALVKGLV